MKRTKQCPKCESRRIGYLPQQPDLDNVAMLDNGQIGDPDEHVHGRPIGVGGTRNTGILAWGNVRMFVGTLEAYVCTDCGYYETYAADPKAVPWATIQGFRWVHPDPAETGPFR